MLCTIFFLQVPATINRYLRDYQREGVKFMYYHYMKDAGAILGDDMGLGKTVQVILYVLTCVILISCKISLSFYAYLVQKEKDD